MLGRENLKLFLGSRQKIIADPCLRGNSGADASTGRPALSSRAAPLFCAGEHELCHHGWDHQRHAPLAQHIEAPPHDPSKPARWRLAAAVETGSWVRGWSNIGIRGIGCGYVPGSFLSLPAVSGYVVLALLCKRWYFACLLLR